MGLWVRSYRDLGLGEEAVLEGVELLPTYLVLAALDKISQSKIEEVWMHLCALTGSSTKSD